jgi:BirA family biotin operon repressor/biotin-[acetyl-CoA-carboxylase] ligase
MDVHAASDPVPQDLFDALGRLKPRGLGAPLVYLRETDSTNDVAAQLAGRGAPEGTLVVAAAQRRGRGREGREWFSPPGAGLYFSLVFRPATTASTLLTLTAGVAVAEGIEGAAPIAVHIKWPNDIVVERWGPAGRERRKVSFIVSEVFLIGVCV